VLVEAYFNKIELETSERDVRATDVNFTGQGKQFTVMAKREVILCAGTVKSPQWLELSGIGWPALLESHRITFVVALGSVLARICKTIPLRFFPSSWPMA
jgi:choline dehydrogenase-like flavoprotein